MHKPVIYWTIGILLLAVVGIGLYLSYTVTKSINDYYVERPVVLKTATDIAWAELTKHFPGGKEGNSGTYELTDVKQSTTNPDEYFVRYAIPNTLDTDVLISVDVKKGTIIEYKTFGA